MTTGPTGKMGEDPEWGESDGELLAGVVGRSSIFVAPINTITFNYFNQSYTEEKLKTEKSPDLFLCRLLKLDAESGREEGLREVNFVRGKGICISSLNSSGNLNSFSLVEYGSTSDSF